MGGARSRVETLEALLERRPPMIKVEEGLDFLRLRLPSRPASSPRARALVVLGTLAVWFPLAWGGGALLERLWGPVDGDRWFPLFFLLYAVPFLAHRLISARGEVRLSQRTLRMTGRRAVELPLEEIEDIDVIAADGRGRLCFYTARGPAHLFDGLFENELEWVRDLVLHHTAPYRAALAAAGHDVQRAGRAPEALERVVSRVEPD